MVATEKSYEGSCHCQKVRYRITGEPGSLSHCHCTDCRKMHGAVFATYLEVPRKQLAYLQGEDQLGSFRAESGTIRGFCRTCGSSLACWNDGEPDTIYIAAGTLDTPLLKNPECHIWVRSRVPWFEIQDGLPQHQTSN
ncbi:MAG: GFA family protein [Acidimicrobiia bacterium]